ncbi:RDD family protein [Amycolatopsis jiangsuensis]|uniref:Putative RDD family membrane protein YckC n=1 Tax=Amycolatopsis jiangsuensis TaxID=1181879 RepID=A0A840J3I8_9PSEU|nr:RDD family protein [Amycolatopsis jiangsuensis]MBB4687864.1 putative RDD family membrane protein YckC [Amycolatopsis jiangsuensis]
MPPLRSRWRNGLGLAGRRLVQAAFDLAIVTVPAVVLMVLVVLVFRPSGLIALIDFLRIAAIVVLTVSTLGFWLLTTWWAYRHEGQTPGMRLLRLRIVAEDGTTPGMWVLVVRQLLMVVDGFAWGLVGLVLIFGTPRHQRLGDLVTRTHVVRANSRHETGLPSPDGDFRAVARP